MPDSILTPPTYVAHMPTSPTRSFGPIRQLFLLNVIALVACAEPLPPPSAAVVSPPPASSSTEREVTCPSQDFAVFLPAFANNDEVRKRFTRSPLELAVRSHRAPVDAPPADRDGMAMTTDATASAHQVFAYRYDPKLGRYEHVGTPLEPLVGEFVADPEWAFEFDVDAQSSDEVRISAGPEPERKTFVFSRSSDCWQLTRAYDFGD